MAKPLRTVHSNFTLLPDETEEPLVKLLEDKRAPYRLRDIDVSHCILANTDQLLHCISRCFKLRSLYCVGCSFTATDVLRMLLHQVRRLEGLRFSLVAEHDIARDMTNMLKEHSEGRSVSSLETIYAEVRGASNLALLEAFVSCCSNLTDLHVHFVGGELPYALSFCEQVTEAFVKLRRLTFTSEVPACLRLEIPTPLDLSDCLRICANTTYIKWPDTKYSCVRLEEIARSCGSPEMRRQLVVVAVYPPEILGEIIKNTGKGIRWKYLCELCLVLVPAKPKRIHYPTIGAEFQPCLRQFFTYNMKALVELNVNSFHFSADLDLTELIKYANLECLKALSAPPCGIRHPGALQRVGETCKLFEELDVRLYRRSHLVRCAVCEMPRALRAEGVTQRNTYAGAMFTRLTLSDLPRPACFDLPVHSNVTHLRLVNLPEDAHPVLALLSDIFNRTRNVQRLLLQQELLPFADDSFVDVLSRLPMLRCLCLLTSFAATDDKAALLFDKLSAVLKDLKVAHLHYRREPDGAEQRVTWFRNVGGQGSQSGRAVLLRDRACIMCSTATFIGLAKPKTHFPIFCL